MDNRYRCIVCNASHPVAEVDEEFPEPKFQRPEQQRLKHKDSADIDDSVVSYSNCMYCDSACPSNVPLSQIHSETRGEYVSEQVSTLSREYVCNHTLANYQTSAAVALTIPRLANFAMNFGPTRWAMEKLLGITVEHDFPEFTSQTFRE